MPGNGQNGDEAAKQSQIFLSLVTSMHMGAMYQLGKVASPISGKIERDLRQAQYTIDLLSMLQAKTAGNLSDEEGEHLRRVISELRLNYVDEQSRPDPPEADTETQDESADEQTVNPEAKKQPDPPGPGEPDQSA
ncbi:MAG: DUF1844 domain-containing protein [Candidatus Zixiibacteriota bacterium]